MKKSLAVLVLSGICVAILFAQEAARPAPAVSLPDALPAPAAAVKPADTPPPVAVAPMPVAQTADQLNPEPATPAAATNAVAEAGTDEIGIFDDLTAGVDVTGGRISLSLSDVELQDVVRLFSRLSNANIIVPDMLDKENPKRIDVNLDNVEWKPALKAILDTHGLELIEKIPDSEVYSIRERPADAPEPVELKIYKLKYAAVNSLVEMVSAMVLKTGGQISPYPARNTVVVQGTAQLISDLDKIIEEIDLPREQVFIEAKFLELSDSASEQLGIDWQVLGSYGIGVNTLSGSYSYDESREDSLTKTTSYQANRFWDISGRSYENLEEEPTEASTVANADGDLVWFNGIDYAGRAGSTGSDASRTYGVTPTMFSGIDNTISSIDDTIVGKTLGATLSADDFSVVLSALKDISGVKVVSNPKIIVANEETASIHIGDKKPNIKGTIQTSGDSQSTTVYALDDTEPYFEDGVQVEVTPTVNTSDNISVNIQPTLDRLDTTPTYAPDGTEYYGKSTKTISTVFSLQSGQTAAIGGLTEVSKTDVDRSVPFLGDLPLLGRLFSYTSSSESQAETIIFVTVGLANPDIIEFETGLPEDSKLAMRHRTEAQADRQIHAEELRILKAMEADRLQERIQALRHAEEDRVKRRDESAGE
jgi:type IV pilus assembly protein PilQ